MAWTQPKTWTNEPLVAGDMNTHLRDNLEALKDPPQGGIDINKVTNYSTTSLTFVDVDATDFVSTITTNGGDVLVSFLGVLASSGSWCYFDIEVDSVLEGNADGLIRKVTTSPDMVFFQYWVKGLSAGSHTFKLKWRTSAGTLTLYGGQTTTNGKTGGQWDVREVS